MPTVTIPYGSEQIAVNAPDGNYLQTISPRTVEVDENGGAIIKAALHHPIGCARPEEIVQPGDQILPRSGRTAKSVS